MNCELCGKSSQSFWNCYEVFNPKKISYRFCEDCKSKWVAFAQSHGVKFQKVEYYGDGCSCNFGNSPIRLVKKLWCEFIKRELWKFTKEWLTNEKVTFT